MALFGKGGRSRKRLLTAAVTVGAVGALQALTMVPAGAVLPGGCTYNPATQTVTIQQQSGDGTEISVVNATGTGGQSNEIQITIDTGGPQDCGSATASNTTSVVLLGSGVTATNEIFQVNNNGTGGSFGSIAFSIDMGNHSAPPPAGGDIFSWIGRTSADTVKVTDTTFEANGGTGTLVGTEYQLYQLLGGHDSFDASGVSGVPLGVLGGDGDDTIVTGNGADNTTAFPLLGGYYGEAGDDWFTAGSSRADNTDIYAGGAGFDTYDAHARTAANWLRNSGVAESGEGSCFGAAPGCEADTLGGDVEYLISGSGNDRLEAMVADTWLNGQAGDDTLDANSNAGVVLDYSTIGTASSPDLNIDLDAGTITGWGNDTIVDDPGSLGVVGGDGDDVFNIVNTSASDTAFGSFCGGPGVDLVEASESTDDLNLDLNSASFDGSGNCGGSVPGSDDSTENVNGGAGDDNVIGNTLANNLVGGDGNDIVAGSNGALGDGRDFLEGGAGNDTYFGGSAADTASFKNCVCEDGGITADISLGFAEGEGSDSFADYVEIIEGSKKGDKIKTGPTGLGSSVNTWIRGFGGGDQLVGSDGNDQIAGGGGNDRIRSGAGDDDMQGGGGNDKFWGGGGVDSADGGAGKNTCKGVEIRKNCKKMKNNRAVSVAAKLARLD